MDKWQAALKWLPHIILGFVWLLRVVMSFRYHRQQIEMNAWRSLFMFGMWTLILWWGGWFSPNCR